MGVVVRPLLACHLGDEADAVPAQPIEILRRFQRRILRQGCGDQVHASHAQDSPEGISCASSMIAISCLPSGTDTRMDTAVEPATSSRLLAPCTPPISWNNWKSVT